MRYIDVDGVHVDKVAAPRGGLAAGGKLEAGDVGDGADWAVVAGDPLRIDQRERAGLHGDRERAADEAAGGFGQVGAEGHRLGGRCGVRGEYERDQSEKGGAAEVGHGCLRLMDVGCL